eukprot:TRINITY_DN14395_c0_g1_i2.p1 TRINITY_DN14395_c0_g1~~TRINITY_DN14395_c0_g1_i2.p1  ORF type:complete len:129 (+),score=15.02 TRINITY_DN14395_c0_g1_i2:186-572(+)
MAPHRRALTRSCCLPCGQFRRCARQRLPRLHGGVLRTAKVTACVQSGNDSASNVDKLLAQVQLVLKPGGKFLLVSFANEEARLEKYLDKASHHWSDIKTKRMCKPSLSQGSEDTISFHYLYECTLQTQ